MVRFLPRRTGLRRIPSCWLRSTSVDYFQRVSLTCSHSCGAKERPQSAHVAPLPANDFAHVRFGNFQLDHVVIEMIDVDRLRLIHNPLRNLFDKSANISRGFSHSDRLGHGSRWSSRGLRVELANTL